VLALLTCGAGLEVLLTMSPLHYHGIRVTLGRGSGQDSPGFNRILDCRPWVWSPFERLMQRHQLSLIDVHRKPTEHVELFRLVSEMMAFDDAFQRFRYGHFSLVRRIIGADVKSLKGIPASTLAKGATEPLFKELWDVINVLTRETSDVYGGH
jgi:tryptophan 2,3-dioxygenase